MTRKTTIFISIITVLLTLLLALTIFIPWQVGKQSNNWVIANTERKLTLGDISFNPFNLTIKIAKSSLSEPNSKATFATFESLTISASILSIVEQAVIIDKIVLTDPVINVEQLDHQNYNFSDFIAAVSKQSNEPPIKSTQPIPFILDKFILSGGNIVFTDKTTTTKMRTIAINDLDCEIHEINYPHPNNINFTADFRASKGGQISLAGTADLTSLEIELKMRIDQLQLTVFNDFIPDQLNITFQSGKLSSDLNISLKNDDNNRQSTLAGDIDIVDFKLQEPSSGEEILSWETLNISGIEGELEPSRVHIKKVAVSNYITHIVIESNGQVNITNITTDERNKSCKVDLNKAASISSGSKPVASKTQLSLDIDDTTLQGGTITFTDKSLSNQFKTTMYKLGGRISGLSSTPETVADIDLRGQLENHSPLTIKGTINPLRDPLFADLTISFNDIDLTPMTPYASIYIGNEINKGKLHLALNYHFENRNVVATNSLLIDHLTLGKKVSSVQATQLPVGLAISLLKDHNEKIHINIPIKGNFDDPGFSISGAIVTVLRNILTKAATAPFGLLTSMLGGNEDFTIVNFSSGNNEISAEEAKKLTLLAEIVADRPAITLEISGFIDSEKDPEGYRQERLKELLGAAKQNKHNSTKNPADLLLAVYEQAQFPRPINQMGELELLSNSEMEKLLLANIIVGETQLQELANARATAVRSVLIEANDSIKQRLYLKSAVITKPHQDGFNSRVEFTLAR